MPASRHLVQPVHAGGGLLGDAFDALADPRPALGVLAERALQQREDHLELLGVAASPAGSGHGAGRLVLGALVHQQRGVAAVVEDHVGAGVAPAFRPRPASAAPARCTTSTPRASRPSRRTPGRRAAPRAYRRARRRPPRRRGPGWRRCCSCTSAPRAPSAVSVSISTAVWTVMCSEPVIRAPRSGCASRVLGADRHQARHLVLGERDFLAPELREGEVGDLEVGVAWQPRWERAGWRWGSLLT